ncbi:hypothetical protein DH2020_007126 [Rehmannia glutinosa]|uniref:CST complex subunit CTC1 n=1 Tax=Rehmannia glutinosa TaxID=99300 RepID=A0ABR0TXF5_REHGL
MAATIGWYGPLIDLCKASSYIGDYVQLLVFVHRITPVQYKIARNGGEVVRMDILVGDETRSYFPVTIWQKQIGSQVLAGHVFLLQSLDEVIGECRVGVTVKDKLQKVVGWLQRARLVHCGSVLNYYEHRSQLRVNWKEHEEIHSQDCSSLLELYQCENSCKANFHASIGEIFLPITWVDLEETGAERMFISRRLHNRCEKSLADDLITTGCQLCGIPVNAGPGYGQGLSLYVWDDLKYLPISVSNKAAEVLFGNVSAEKVFLSYKNQRPRKEPANPHVSITDRILRMKDKKAGDEKPNFYMIWLILLKMLFQHGKNNPLKFKVTVDRNRDWESGRLEMLSVSFPAFRKITSA